MLYRLFKTLIKLFTLHIIDNCFFEERERQSNNEPSKNNISKWTEKYKNGAEMSYIKERMLINL